MERISRFRQVLVSLSLGLTAATAAHALTFVKATDAQLVDLSPVIVRAVARPLERGPAVAGSPLTFYSLEVELALRGAAAGEKLELAVPGGLGAGGSKLIIEGAPVFADGEEALFFLERSPAGHLRIVHFHQGVFRLGRLSGQRAAWRAFDREGEIAAAGRQAEAEAPRGLEKFEAWISDRLAGTARPADYRLARPPAGALETEIEPFGILERNGLPARWDKGSGQLAITFYAHPAPQPGVPGGGHDRVQVAVDTWSAIPGGNLRLRYGGLTDTTAGFHYDDGVNAYVFNDFDDANGDAPGFNCETQSGALAYARIWVQGSHIYGGRQFATIVSADSVISKDTNCWSRFTPGAFERTVAHEMGHMLGLAHSCNTSEDDPCSPEERLSILYPGNPGGNTGAFLGEDDHRAIRYLYGVPETPASLRAQLSEQNRVRLTWEDRSENETGYLVYRETGGREELIASLAPDATGFDDVSARPVTVYRYRVRAENDNGLSAAAETTVTTVALDTPAQLRAVAAGPESIALAWVDKSGEEDGYEVWGRLTEGGQEDELLASLPANAEAATIGDLIADSNYSFKVRATGVETGTTAFSNLAQATTLLAAIEPCADSAGAACLGGERFKVEVRWKDFQGGRGNAQAAPAGSADSGIFYFFSPNNWEMLVKVLDGCAINGHQWVFAAGTTNVETTLIVTDSATGKTAVYFNKLGTPAPAVTDIEAFAGCGETASAAKTAPAAGAAPLCADGSGELCLLGGRYRVHVSWTDFAGASGPGRPVPAGTTDSGLLYFFSPDNWEMLVKVLDGCAINGKVWVFAAATTNVAYTLEIEDTTTGARKTYVNPLGQASAAIGDVDAFATCSSP